MTREDFYKQVATQDDTTIGVSQGELLLDDNSNNSTPCCLVQVGTEDGDYRCAYLDEEQARELAAALLEFAELPE